MTLGELSTKINGIGADKLFNSVSDSKIAENNSFSNMLNKGLQDLNQSQVEAYDAMQSIATGKVENLQEAVQTIQEAEMSLKLALEVKNKALSAYKQIMQMQV